VYNERHDGAEDSSPGPENTIGEPLSFYKPFIKVKDEWIVEQSSTDAIEKALSENKINHMCREGCGEKRERDCEETNN
jgi:hypothetical protein